MKNVTKFDVSVFDERQNTIKFTMMQIESDKILLTIEPGCSKTINIEYEISY